MSTVTVHALSTGHLTLPERFFISPSDPNARRTVPSLSFLIQHHAPEDSTTTRIVFDLGMRRSTSLYPTELQNHIANRSPVSTRPDIVESLAKGGLTVDDIDFVIFSHVHYDHVGYPKDFTNTKTKFIVGPGALALLKGDTTLNIGSHSFFESDLLPLERTVELPPLPPSKTSQPKDQSHLSTSPLNLSHYSSLKPFPHTLDLLPNHPGAIYIISAPGHLPGHINLLCRTSTSTQTTPPPPSNPHLNQDTIPPSPSTKYILLAGDSCHDIRLFNGTHDIATWTDDDGKPCCIHHDIPAAKETIKKLRDVSLNGIEVTPNRATMTNNNSNNNTADSDTTSKIPVEVVFAHNWEWEEDAIARGRFWPGRL